MPLSSIKLPKEEVDLDDGCSRWILSVRDLSVYKPGWITAVELHKQEIQQSFNVAALEVSW